jgi:hypothetical protein
MNYNQAMHSDSAKNMVQGTHPSSRLIISLILLGLALVTSLNAWHALIHDADWWPYFVDELVNTQAAVNFLRSGNYTSNRVVEVIPASGRFPPRISTGLAVTWPSAIAWTFGSNLLTSRLSVGLATWALFLLVGWLFLRTRTFPTPLILFLLASTWSLSIVSPLAVPDAPYFLLNMGELVGALWIGLGLLLVRKSFYAAATMWGIATWLCKFIYAPLVIGFGAAWAITSPERRASRLRQTAVFLGWFLAPLFVWLIIIWARFDSATMLSWIRGWVNFLAIGGHGLNNIAHVSTLLARLNSPELWWYTFAWDWKAKILILTVGAIVVSVSMLLGRPHWVTDSLSKRLLLVVVGCVSVYTAWYFLWHPTMWIRHIHPALYLGLGLYLYWLQQMVQRYKLFIERHQWLWLGLAAIVVGLQTIATWRTPLLELRLTYARTCTDLFSPNCGDYSTLTARMRETPGSVVISNGPRPPNQAFEDFYGPPEFVVPTDCSGQTEAVREEQLHQITEGHSELWLLRTMPVQCDPNGFVPRWLAEHAYPAEEFWLQNNLFTRYLVASDFKAQGTQAGQLGDSISLVAWSIDEVTIAPGQALNVALTWVSTNAPMQDHRVFVFLADQSEQVAALRDAVPTMWLRPTGTWQPGELITDHHGLLIPPEGAPGDYWLGVGMYNSATGVRLPVTAGEGWLNSTALKLTLVTIQPP